MFLNIFKVMHY